MTIDIHTHIVPQKLPTTGFSSLNSRWPQIELAPGGKTNVMVAGKVVRTINELCWNMESRIADMDREGIEIQVLSAMPALFSYWADADETAFFCRYINEEIARMVEYHPGRFVGLGIVPLQNPETAARELVSIKDHYRLAGVQVGSNIEGRTIGDPFFTPFFEEAERLGLAVFVHPVNPVGSERIVGPSLLSNFVGFPSETAFAAASVITGRVLEKFPLLRIGFSHGGGGFGMVLPRMIQAWEQFPAFREQLPQCPSEYGKKLFFDALVYDQRTLRYLLEIFSSRQLMVGSDYPFKIREKPAGASVASLNLPAEDKRLLQKENALRFLYGENIRNLEAI
jgi:aminocarboxymuconate-semialdehyde decarboxylase